MSVFVYWEYTRDRLTGVKKKEGSASMLKVDSKIDPKWTLRRRKLLKSKTGVSLRNLIRFYLDGTVTWPTFITSLKIRRVTKTEEVTD